MEFTQEQGMASAALALERVCAWMLWLTEGARWLLSHGARRAARHHAWASLRGLRSPVERKNGWQVAAVNGEAPPYDLQHVLGRARWEAEAAREARRASLVQSLGDPQALRVLEETGLLQKGQPSVGMARQ